jgi:hypothetical protein
MPVFVPTFPDSPNYSMGVVLDGTAYLLTFRLSERESCYFLDLALQDGTPLVSGKRVVCKVSLFHRQRYNVLVPQGHLGVSFPKNGNDDPPNLGELGEGRRCMMFYFTKAELPY